jgi:hypothetical protein
MLESVKRAPETFDGAGNVITLTPPKIDLRDGHAIRRELAAVYRDMRAGRVDMSDGTKLAYVLEMLRRSHETATLQDRIEGLEIIIERRES